MRIQIQPNIPVAHCAYFRKMVEMLNKYSVVIAFIRVLIKYLLINICNT